MAPLSANSPPTLYDHVPGHCSQHNITSGTDCQSVTSWVQSHSRDLTPKKSKKQSSQLHCQPAAQEVLTTFSIFQLTTEAIHGHIIGNSICRICCLCEPTFHLERVTYFIVSYQMIFIKQSTGGNYIGMTLSLDQNQPGLRLTKTVRHQNNPYPSQYALAELA